MKSFDIKVMIGLHVMLMIYSLSGICSKLAAGEEFLSFRFCLLYGGVILLLFIYAVGWQQIIKRMPLSTAFANKAMTVVWGLVWGAVVFGEKITPGKIAGVILVIIGIVSYALSDGSEQESAATDPSGAAARTGDQETGDVRVCTDPSDSAGSHGAISRSEAGEL